MIKRTFAEEEVERQKDNAQTYVEDAFEYANNVKVIG